MNKKILFYLMMSVLMAGCAAGDSESLGDKPPVGATSDGKYAVGFNAYANRAVTRAGYAGTLTIDQLQQAQGDLGGFGVFAYYTDLKKYDQTYIPNFMYNQGVFYSGGNWEYTPVMYWPNEYGSDAGSDDEDKVTFFAYAPYVHHSSPAAGSVDGDASWGITGFSRNTTAGDPIVKYIASFNPAQSVDLCWGVCDQASWNRIQNNGSQSMTTGLPWLDVEHPQGVNQKMTFTFKHALSQLNVQIDADADGLTHDASGDIADGTKIYVRSISFTGIALKGALNLNNTVANKALWLDYAGTTDLPFGESVTVKDGRRDGREGSANAEATNEIPSGLNDAIIQKNTDTDGVTHTAVNLFNSNDLDKCVYVIPTGEKMTVTIVYDVETTNPHLSTYISDGTTHGVSIENKITKDILFGGATSGLDCGKKYTIKLHLGMNSVKFDADITPWDDGDVVNGEGWLPGNLAIDAPVTLSLGSSLTMALSGGAQTLTATTQPAGQTVNWTNSDDGVATIAAAGGGTRGEVNGASSITITPVAAGTTIITATSAAGSAQCAVTVTTPSTPDVTVSLNKTSTTVYATETEQLTATTSPADRPVTWVSSNTAAAIVSSAGLVTANAAGLTHITVTTESGKTATCDVTVAPTVLSLDKTSLSLNASESYTLTATTTPIGKTVTYESSAPTVASVNESTGLVTGLTAGTARITATIPGGGSATCNVTVTANAATVTAPPTAITPLTYNGNPQALVNAGTAANGTMQYAIGNSSAATSAYSADIPTATAAGTHYVWYKAAGNVGYTDSAPDKVSVSIAKAAGTISFANGSYNKQVGDANFTQEVTKTGDGAVTYSTSNSSIADVNSSTGAVTIGSTTGTATITATVTDGDNYSYASKTATYTVTVSSKPAATLDSAPTAKELTYSGSAQALVNAGTATGGTVKYAKGTNSAASESYSTSIPEATDAGTYYVWYYVEGDASHSDTAPDKVAVTMAKKAATISFGTASYNKEIGEANFTQALTNTGTAGSVEYSIENSGSSALIDDSTGEVTIGSAAGTATVTCTVTDGANYTYATKTASYTITITAPPSPTASPSVGNWTDGGNGDLTPDKTL